MSTALYKLDLLSLIDRVTTQRFLSISHLSIEFLTGDFLAIKVRWGVFLVRPQISQTRDGTISILNSSCLNTSRWFFKISRFFKTIPGVGITEVPETDIYNSLIINRAFSLGPGISNNEINKLLILRRNNGFQLEVAPKMSGPRLSRGRALMFASPIMNYSKCKFQSLDRYLWCFWTQCLKSWWRIMSGKKPASKHVYLCACNHKRDVKLLLGSVW